MWLVLCLLCLFFLGCSGNGGETEEERCQENSKHSKAPLIGISFDSFVIERWIRDRDVFVSTAKKLGADVNVQTANGSLDEQISQIEYLIKKGVDVLVVVAADCSALSNVMKEAKDAGIRTISYDRLIMDANTDLYVSFDNRKVGVLMAESLKEAIPEGGEIFMIQGPEEDNNVRLIREGFEQELEGSSLEVVFKAKCEGWHAEYAASYVNSALLKYPEVKGIMCGNDDIATQVIRVLSEKRLAGKIAVVGQDGDLAACQRIVEGSQTMTAFKCVEQLAQVAAKYAVQLAQGKEVEELGNINGSMNDGSYEIPFGILEPVAVNRKNIDEIIIDGGFHAEEEVYLNVRNRWKNSIRN